MADTAEFEINLCHIFFFYLLASYELFRMIVTTLCEKTNCPFELNFLISWGMAVL